MLVQIKINRLNPLFSRAHKGTEIAISTNTDIAKNSTFTAQTDNNEKNHGPDTRQYHAGIMDNGYAADFRLFHSMAYSMTDMLWLGHLSSDAVAAVGAAAFFTWLCNALSFLTKTGSEITISQAIGAQDVSRAAKYANQAIALSLLLSIGYAIFIFTSAPTLIRFFHFEESIATQSIQYLRIIAPGFIFQLGNNTFCGIYNGQGNSKTPFRTIATGLIANIILDPLLIYGTGEYKGLGTAGAATATLLSQLIVYLLFIQKIFSSGFPLGKMHFFSALQKNYPCGFCFSGSRSV